MVSKKMAGRGVVVALAAVVAIVGFVGKDDLRAMASSYVPGFSSNVTEVSIGENITTREIREYLAILEAIPVKGKAPKTGYSRDQFGPAWTDDVDVSGGHNGCDTRNDRLFSQLTDVTFKPGTRDCVVLSGVLNDPYTGKTINFVRGIDTSSAVQVDHAVSLSQAWQTGAQNLTARERQNFANDPENLIVSDGPTNQQKSDSDLAAWMPPNKAFRCQFATIQIAVKKKYQLWVTPPEKDAMMQVLDSCAAAVNQSG